MNRFLQCIFLVSCTASCTQPVRLHHENSHYLEYQNEPILLITAGEHYGALINLEFDYIAYLDALAADGMNSTRIFSGSMFEREPDIPWMKYNNTLAPKPGRVVVPWARSSVPGYSGGGNKFDLDSWDPDYFMRLKDLLAEAGKRRIIVELVLFGNQYKDEIWQNSPLFPGNNRQGEGPSGNESFKLFQTLHNKHLVNRQEKMVEKIVTETNSFDNLYYEISNEPYNEAVDTSDVNDWHAHFVQYITKLESNLPKKHLIATNEAVVDHPDVSVANYHYVKVKTMPAFDWLLSLDKVISMDETVGSVIHSDVDDVRAEAWDFIMRGGGAYNNLSWEHTPYNEAGTADAMRIRKQLYELQRFMSKLDYVKMRPSPAIVIHSIDSAFVRTLAEPGRQYVVYIHHSRVKGSDWIVGYDAVPGRYSDQISLVLSPGTYVSEWIEPASGRTLGAAQTFTHPGSHRNFATPEFTIDLALRIVASK